MKNFYAALAVVALVGIAAVAYLMRGGNAASEPVDLGDIEDQELVAMAQGVVYGDEDAPINIVEFGNYQCPACMTFALQVKPQVDLAYIGSGQAKLTYFDFPTPGLPHSFLAARAARCAGDQDLYWAYHDQMYRTQRAWSIQSDPGGHFKDLAEDAGLDANLFRECLDSDRHADVVTANQMLAQRMGIAGTPTILIHQEGSPSQRLGGFQFLDIQRAVESRLDP